MKPTTCGKWAHVACAQWIPETTFVDPETVEPVDGIARIGRARLSLLVGFSGEYAIGHRDTCFESNARDRRSAFVTNDFKVISFATNDCTQRNQRVKLKGFCHTGERDAKLERTRHGHDHDVALVNTKGLKLLQARIEFDQANVFVKAGAHNTDVQAFSVHVWL
jgi:hypothetical protein